MASFSTAASKPKNDLISRLASCSKQVQSGLSGWTCKPENKHTHTHTRRQNLSKIRALIQGSSLVPEISEHYCFNECWKIHISHCLFIGYKTIFHNVIAFHVTFLLSHSTQCPPFPVFSKFVIKQCFQETKRRLKKYALLGGRNTFSTIQHFHVMWLPPCWRAKQYNYFSPLGNKIYFQSKLFHCFSPPARLPWKPSIAAHFGMYNYSAKGRGPSLKSGSVCFYFYYYFYHYF